MWFFDDGLLYFGMNCMNFYTGGSKNYLRKVKNSLLQNLDLTLAFLLPIFQPKI